jgi:hypothetical protein
VSARRRARLLEVFGVRGSPGAQRPALGALVVAFVAAVVTGLVCRAFGLGRGGSVAAGLALVLVFVGEAERRRRRRR